MGYNSWNDDFYRDREVKRKKDNVPAMKHDADVKAGKVATALHPSLNVLGVKVRESRDSPAHPNSKAIIIATDITGSMGGVPRRIQQRLPEFMGLLLKKGWCVDPHILVAAIGDATCDKVPFQAGQFESGIEIDNDITNLYVEGGGGGQNTESYELALYFAARKTDIDCLNKRNQKGYLFITGDEHPYRRVSRDQIKRVFGDDVESDIPLKDIVREAAKKYHLFFLIPQTSTANADRAGLEEEWANLFGNEHVLRLDDPEGVCEVVGSAIGLIEGSADPTAYIDDLKASGSDTALLKSIASALDPLAKSVTLARAGTASMGGLPDAPKAGKTARL